MTTLSLDADKQERETGLQELWPALQTTPEEFISQHLKHLGKSNSARVELLHLSLESNT